MRQTGSLGDVMVMKKLLSHYKTAVTDSLCFQTSFHEYNFVPHEVGSRDNTAPVRSFIISILLL